MYAFYVERNPRNLRKSVSKKLKLNEIYPLKGEKPYYLFDFGHSWLFEIAKSRKKILEDEKVTYPLLIESTGVYPEQYPECEDFEE